MLPRRHRASLCLFRLRFVIRCQLGTCLVRFFVFIRRREDADSLFCQNRLIPVIAIAGVEALSFIKLSSRSSFLRLIVIPAVRNSGSGAKCQDIVSVTETA